MTTQARQLRSMEGVTYTLGRITIAFKRSDGDADGAFSVAESLEPPGAGAGLHRHPSFRETFIVCEGRYEFEVDGERFTLGAGETLVVPLGASHVLKSVGSETGRLLAISTPGGLFEAFIRDVSTAMVDTGRPTDAPAVDFRAIAARHGIEFLA